MLIAAAANIVVMVAKLVAGILTGSSAMHRHAASRQVGGREAAQPGPGPPVRLVGAGLLDRIHHPAPRSATSAPTWARSRSA